MDTFDRPRCDGSLVSEGRRLRQTPSEVILGPYEVPSEELLGRYDKRRRCAKPDMLARRRRLDDAAEAAYENALKQKQAQKKRITLSRHKAADRVAHRVS